MAALNQIHPVTPLTQVANTAANTANSSWERRKSLVLRAWILSGIFFMTVPGTLLGFSNLIAISARHGLATLPPAWLEGHGHAQIFGWIGSFVLGIGFFSQPSRGRSSVITQLCSLALWISGVALRWIANIHGWEWRILLPVSGGFELVAVTIFLRAASRHKMPEPTTSRPRRGIPSWMALVLLGTAGLAAAVIFNFVECLRLALYSSQPAFPHMLDQKYLLLLGWGFIVPTVWGFSAKWFPAMLSVGEADAKRLRVALVLVVAAIFCGIFGWIPLATIVLALSTVIVLFALRLFERTRNADRSFSWFVRSAYLWLAVAAGMSIWAAYADHHGGIWGASRHALTVGFAATMVFTIGPRILPFFAGVREIFSKRLALLCLLVLQTGCALRVISEPLAYEGFTDMAWKALPFSGMLELSAVLLFALNLMLTFLCRASGRNPQKPLNTSLVNISLHRGQ